jgi:hypothetical protein
LTIDGANSFIGILLYAVGTDPLARIGKWSLKDGIQGNANCASQELQDPTSVITHTSGASFKNRTQFEYEIPQTGFDGEISFNAIIMQKVFSVDLTLLRMVLPTSGVFTRGSVK